jgi:signal transduction histidine kinase
MGLAWAVCGLVVVLAVFVVLRSERRCRRRVTELEQALRHATRIENVGEIASMTVHELRNQQQVMLGHVLLGLRDPGASAASLTRIRDALLATSESLERLLSLAHPRADRPEILDLAEEVAGIGPDLERLLPPSIHLELALAPEGCLVHLDRVELRHALISMAINSKQAIDGIGRIRIEVGQDDDQFVRLAFSDNGCGIPPDVLPKVCRPFFTTKPPGQGTGLGLTGVQRFVEGSHGRLQVESQQGAGTRLVLRFPRLRRPLAGLPDHREFQATA